MKNSTTRKLIVTMLVMALLSTMLFTIVASGSEAGTVTYSMTADEITAFAAGAKADGDSEQLGTDGYFNVFYSAKTKVDASAKTFEDGVAYQTAETEAK